MHPIALRLTREDVREAMRLSHLASIHSRVALGVVVGLPLFYAGLYLWMERPASRSWQTAGLVFLVGGAGLYALLRVRHAIVPRRAADRALREQRNLGEPASISWSAQSYAVHTVTAHSDLPWDHFWLWRENDRMLLLYQSSRFYQILPKRVLPPGALAEIHGSLNAAGVKKARLFLS